MEKNSGFRLSGRMFELRGERVVLDSDVARLYEVEPAALLKDALMRCASAAKTIGVRAVLMHAVDDGARSFYEKYGFERSPISEFTLMLLMKDLRASLQPALRREVPGLSGADGQAD